MKALGVFTEKMIMEFTETYLFYSSITTDQLFPQVCNVVVIFLHVLLEVVPSERQQWLLHLALKL